MIFDVFKLLYIIKKTYMWNQLINKIEFVEK